MEASRTRTVVPATWIKALAHSESSSLKCSGTKRSALKSAAMITTSGGKFWVLIAASSSCSLFKVSNIGFCGLSASRGMKKPGNTGGNVSCGKVSSSTGGRACMGNMGIHGGDATAASRLKLKEETRRGDSAKINKSNSKNRTGRPRIGQRESDEGTAAAFFPVTVSSSASLLFRRVLKNHG